MEIWNTAVLVPPDADKQSPSRADIGMKHFSATLPSWLPGHYPEAWGCGSRPCTPPRLPGPSPEAGPTTPRHSAEGRARAGPQVLIHRLPADAELPRQLGLGLPRRRALPQLGDAVLTQDAFATAVGAAGLGQGDALRWRSPINARSNSANAPITDSNSCAMGLSSPVNVRCSLRNSTRTAVSARIVPTNAIRSMPDVGASYRSGWFDLGSVAPCATPST